MLVFLRVGGTGPVAKWSELWVFATLFWNKLETSNRPWITSAAARRLRFISRLRPGKRPVHQRARRTGNVRRGVRFRATEHTSTGVGSKSTKKLLDFWLVAFDRKKVRPQEFGGHESKSASASRMLENRNSNCSSRSRDEVR